MWWAFLFKIPWFISLTEKVLEVWSSECPLVRYLKCIKHLTSKNHYTQMWGNPLPMRQAGASNSVTGEGSPHREKQQGLVIVISSPRHSSIWQGEGWGLIFMKAAGGCPYPQQDVKSCWAADGSLWTLTKFIIQIKMYFPPGLDEDYYLNARK